MKNFIVGLWRDRKTLLASLIALAYAALQAVNGDWATAGAVAIPALNALGLHLSWPAPTEKPCAPSPPPSAPSS